MVQLEDAKSYMMIDFSEKDNDIINFIEEAKTIISNLFLFEDISLHIRQLNILCLIWLFCMRL